MKRSILFILALTVLMTVTIGVFAAPTAVITTPGVTPRDVLVDTTDIYTKPSRGLPNVGLGELVYLAGNAGDTAITAWTWTLTAKPNSSSLALTGTDQAVIAFRPDVTGKFVVTLEVTSAGGQADTSISINSANYVGVGGIAGQGGGAECITCHSGQLDIEDPDKVTPWSATKHASKFTRNYSGSIGGVYRASCIGCHTTGFNKDTTAVNGGFDDRAVTDSWTFIDSANGGIVPGAFDSMKVHYSNTAKMANIQCENCHGPGSRHIGNTDDNRMAASFEVSACALCHDSGTRYYRPMQWKLSGHSRQVKEERSGCANCHSGIGFVDKLDGMNDTLVTRTYMPIGCATCHDPHDASNPKQVRTVDPYMLIDSTVVDFGMGNLCVNCHHARRLGTAIVDSRVNNAATPRWDPHASPQADMVAGKNAFTFGQQAPEPSHAIQVSNVCVGCHMAATPTDANDAAKFLQLGDHTFHMKTAAGAEHTEVCATCHGDINSFDDIMAEDDWDGDGSAEAVTAEIAGLMARVDNELPPAGPGFAVKNWWTGEQRRAAWNYNFVKNDGSGGLHNPGYTKTILQAALGAGLSVEQTDENVPASYSLTEAYPNPFNPTTAFKYDLAKNGNVSIKVFDMAGRLVSTVVSGEFKAGHYRTSVDLGGQPSGMYLLRMQAGSFDASRKMVLVK